jgi:putative nucleotide binding protein
MSASDPDSAESDDPAVATRHAIVIDMTPQTTSDRPLEGTVISEADFRLYETTFVEGAEVSIGDRLVLAPTEEREEIDAFREVTFADLTSTARNELDYAIDAILEADPERFLAVYNEAGPISLRLHQLNLLPGIGTKLRDAILDARKRGPFESFDAVAERVDGLHRPREIVAERIIEELEDESVKYHLFVGVGE